jgi:dihydrofolate reductase
MTKRTAAHRGEPVAKTEVVYSAAVSLDGYIADGTGGVDWLHAAMVKGESYGLGEFMASIDAVLLGSRTYEKALTLGDFGAGSKTPTWIFSKRQFRTKGAVVVTSADPGEIVASLPRQGLRRAWLMGGGQLASSFLRAGLIDTISLGVMPVVLGSGIPLFAAGIPPTTLELIEQKTYKGGALGLTYRLRR